MATVRADPMTKIFKKNLKRGYIISYLLCQSMNSGTQMYYFTIKQFAASAIQIYHH
ncbi:hypothetical protein SLEP1_g25096 [Rubroshorea leprosula]|uniref:Uncharacterized protein n=1 Tax=Rubroshorea leprosula TaxID=152421 RepID=A0AAV5JRJ7_9ROSI|nr:hypothetical protein SLEP1_g25096 [Rubroshorea leprosula]